MGLLDFLWSLLAQLGLWKKSASILIIGLDNAGKTTLLYRLKTGKVMMHLPTQRPKLEEFEVGALKVRAFDVGGHENVRRVWSTFYDNLSAIIFILDSVDRERFEEAADELAAVLEEEGIQSVPIAVLANKCDLQTAASKLEVVDRLELSHSMQSRPGPIQVFQTSSYSGMGIMDAMQWISDHV
eukprot:Rmarinus@m.24632